MTPLTEEYKTAIENNHLKELLLRRENLPVLEEVLVTESNEVARLNALKERKQLDFGAPISPEELDEVAATVYDEVNTFLDVKPKDSPACIYPSLFTLPEKDLRNIILALYGVAFPLLEVPAIATLDIPCAIAGLAALGVGAIVQTALKQPRYIPRLQKIVLKKRPITELLPTIGHEYAHHIHHSLAGLSCQNYDIFKEGHARGVERYIANFQAVKDNNEVFLLEISDWTVGELKSAYLWLCRTQKIQPTKSLLQPKSCRDLEEMLSRFYEKQPTPHAIGNALFLIYEAQYGRDIYRQAIHGEFQFR